MSYNLLLNGTFAMRAAAIFAAARPDIIIGAAIWTLKQTYDGVYYLCFNSGNKEETIELNKKLLDKLVNKSDSQELEIKKLNENINILTNYIKNNT